MLNITWVVGYEETKLLSEMEEYVAESQTTDCEIWSEEIRQRIMDPDSGAK